MEKVQDRESMGTLEILDAMGTQNMFDFANTLNHVKSFSNDPRKNKAIKKLEEILKINPEIKEIQDLLSEINNNNIILYNFKEE